jgi:hypothetical protein
VNILLITSSSMDYVLFVFIHRAHACECASARVRARAWLNISLSLEGFTSNSLGIYYDHKLDGLHTYHVHAPRACESTCSSARVIKNLLIYGQMFFKFAVNILQITPSSMDYVLFMSTHRAIDDHTLHVLHTYPVHAPRACVWACVFQRAHD